MEKSSVIETLAAMKPVTDLRAVPPGTAPTAPAAGAAEIERQLDVRSNVAMADVRSLQKAGWTFEAAGEARSGTAFDVVVAADGHVKLVGRALTVKVSPELDRAAVDTLLAPKGLTVRRQLGFAANTFLLEAKDGSALSAAQALNALPEVLYAEPNLIEPIGAR